MRPTRRDIYIPLLSAPFCFVSPHCDCSLDYQGIDLFASEQNKRVSYGQVASNFLRFSSSAIEFKLAINICRNLLSRSAIKGFTLRGMYYQLLYLETRRRNQNANLIPFNCYRFFFLFQFFSNKGC